MDCDREPMIPPPEKYEGEVEESRPFLTQYELLFEVQPSAFLIERAKVAFITPYGVRQKRGHGRVDSQSRLFFCIGEI